MLDSLLPGGRVVFQTLLFGRENRKSGKKKRKSVKEKGTKRKEK
jgi:hypothetical protein